MVLPPLVCQAALVSFFLSVGVCVWFLSFIYLFFFILPRPPQDKLAVSCTGKPYRRMKCYRR